MKNILEQFIQNLNDEKFAEAHETMEQQWKVYKKIDHPLTKLLKGYINGASAFELVNRGKMDAAVRLWSAYEKYLPALQVGIEEYELFVESDRILHELYQNRLRQRGVLSSPPN